MLEFQAPPSKGAPVDILLGIWFLCLVVTAMISTSRGDTLMTGILLGLFLGPLGVLVALVKKVTPPTV